MNMDEVKGNWKQIKGQAKQHWGELSDDELTAAEGDRERLIGLVQARYGKVREEAEREVDDFIERQ